MNEEQISQTLLDQMVSSDRGQMIKAAIPYLPPKGQQIFSVYEKAVEFINTVSVFSKRSSGSDLCAMSMRPRIRWMSSMISAASVMVPAGIN